MTIRASSLRYVRVVGGLSVFAGMASLVWVSWRPVVERVPDVERPTAADRSIAFAPNQGQWAPEARFHARTPGYDVWLADTEVVFAAYAASPAPDAGWDASMPMMEWRRAPLERTVVRMALDGGRAPQVVTPSLEQPGVRNYYFGDDPERWWSGVPTYGLVRYAETWDSVDLVFRGNENRLEYDVVVRPGGDPSDVVLAFTGADELALDDDGNLVVRAGPARIVQRVPTVYQERGGERVEREGRFVLLDGQRVGFWVDDYDPDRALVIDPEVLFATVLGGSVYEEFWGLAASDDGSVLVSGGTASPDFPTRRAYDDEYPGGPGQPLAAVVTRYGPDGEIRYSTYIGGTGNDAFLGAALDSAKRAYVGGASGSADFPHPGGKACHGGADDMTLAVLSPSGELQHATCLGREGLEFVRNLTVEKGESGAWTIYAEGASQSYDFPIVGGFQTEFGGVMDGVLLAYDPGAAQIMYSTFFGGGLADGFHSIAVRDGGIVGSYARFASFPRPIANHWYRVADELSEGRGVWWCGEYDGEGWVNPPGYGNTWYQGLTKHFELPGGTVSLEWVMQYDTELDYDYVFVQVWDGSTWATLAEFDGTSAGYESFSLDLSAYAGQGIDLRFAFSSDGGWSDEDGIYGADTNGAVRIDEVTVTGHATDDFESGGDGWTPVDILAIGPVDTDYLYGPGGGPEDGGLLLVDTNQTGEASLLASARIGGTAFDNGLGVAFGADRDVFVTGITCSPDAPATPGAAKEFYDALGCQAHVARLAPDLSELKYYTFVGGSVDDRPLAITVNANGEATISGLTQSPDFPTTPDAPFPDPLDEVLFDLFLEEPDAFAATVSADGSEIVFGSYFGGSRVDIWGSHAEDSHGTLSLVFQTRSPDAYVTDDSSLGAFQSGYVLRVGEPREDVDPD